ncbi:serine protease [Rhizobium sp. UGM030330-04]|uniref:trypsin-like serine peptidase n=1 Tax=Rhizobium sp. UGM030330-04 TaxID=1378077 RepID=UPI000D9DA3F5|nr:serine protease [Rhizobium sp. UGM030330-04]PYG53017.1 trypsin-like peptidase [Rhizobium sp. UGM030330-04]
MKHLLSFSLSTLILIISGINAQEQSSSTTDDPEEHWTKERMLNAIPISPPEISEEELKNVLQRSKTSDDLKIEKEDRVVLEKSESPPPPTRADLNRVPYKNAGKLFSREGTEDYFCTAQFVQKGETRNNIILTAAHCLRSGDVWKSNFSFCLRCNDNQGERFSWECATVHPDWLPGGRKRPENDYGFIRIAPPLPEELRALELGVSGDLPSRVIAIGYPWNYNQSKYMYKVRRDINTSSGPTRMSDNPFRGGNSGGAWVDPQQRRKVFGLFSTKFFGMTLSPRFDSMTSQQVQEIYQKAINCTPDDTRCTCKPQLKNY